MTKKSSLFYITGGTHEQRIEIYLAKILYEVSKICRDIEDLNENVIPNLQVVIEERLFRLENPGAVF